MNRLFLVLASVVLLWPPAQAQVRGSAADMRYCAALSQLYMSYVGNPEFAPRGVRRNDVAGDTALAQCRDGNVTSAILVLERKLAHNRITLPARE